MRAADETTEQRLKRWRKLRGHLRDVGLDEDPPADLLLEPEPTTRPKVPLVAHYDEIKQESFGTSRLAVVGVLVRLAAFASVWVLGWFADIEGQSIPLWSAVLGVVLLWVFVEMVLRAGNAMVVRKDELCLTLEELSLSLPDGRRHARWTDIYAVSVTKRGKWFNKQRPWVRKRKAPCVRVELNDGVVARLHMDEVDRQPLADLMTDFLLCARNDGRPLRDHAAAPELATRTSPPVDNLSQDSSTGVVKGRLQTVAYEYGKPLIGMALGDQRLFSGDDANWETRWQPSKPAAAATLWRYMSFAKLCSLLEHRMLFFSLVGDMEDRDEGFIYPSLRDPGDPLRPAEDTGIQKLHEIVRSALINCWAASDHESELMWTKHAGAGGVAVRTTFQDLKESIRSGAEEHPVTFGQVKYVDYRQQQVPRFGWAPLFHKRTEYRGEEEVRAVLPGPPFDPDVRDIRLDLDVEEQRGRYVPVDLDILVKQVVVSPRAEPWFAEVVKSAVRRSKVGACVIPSTI